MASIDLIQVRRKLIGRVPHGRGNGSPTGDMLDLLAAIYAKGARNLYVPNGSDVFGWHAFVTQIDTSGTTTDTRVGTPGDLNAGGYAQLASGGASFTYNTAPGITGRPLAILLQTTASSHVAGFIGKKPSTATARSMHPTTATFSPGGYTKAVMEGVFYLTGSITGSDLFIGWSANFADPWSTSSGYGLGYQSGDTNLSILRNNAGVITKTSTGIAVALSTVYKYYASWDGTTLTVTINGTTVAATTGFPTFNYGNAIPGWILNGRAATTCTAYSEWHIDRFD